MNEENTKTPKSDVAQSEALEVHTKTESVEPELVVTHQPANVSTPKSSRKKWIGFTALGIVLGLLICAILSCLIVYFFPNMSQFSGVRHWLVRTFPFPVAVAQVDGVLVSVRLSTYENNVTAAEHFFDKQEEYGLSLAARPTVEVLREQEYDRELELAYAERLAKKMKITVSQDDINAYYTDTILPQAASESEIEKTLTDLYNWSVAEFKQSVLYPVVLRKKLSESMSSDGEGDRLTKEKAQKVLDEVKKGEKSFEDLAKEHSDDSGSAADGGKLGSFGRGVMVTEFEDASFALQPGQVSELVKTEYGYHIIKVTGRDDAAQTVEAQHILIAFETVDSRVDDFSTDAKVYSFMPHYAKEKEEDNASATVNPYTNVNNAANTNAATNTNSTADTNTNTNQ